VSDKESQRTNVLLEEVLTHVRAVAEGHELLAEKLSGLRTEVDHRFGRIDATLFEHGQRLGRIEHHVGLNGTSAPKRAKAKPATKAKPRGR
jgi:hypothetical protein